MMATTTRSQTKAICASALRSTTCEVIIACGLWPCLRPLARSCPLSLARSLVKAFSCLFCWSGVLLSWAKALTLAAADHDARRQTCHCYVKQMINTTNDNKKNNSQHPETDPHDHTTNGYHATTNCKHTACNAATDATQHQQQSRPSIKR